MLKDEVLVALLSVGNVMPGGGITVMHSAVLISVGSMLSFFCGIRAGEELESLKVDTFKNGSHRVITLGPKE